MSPNLPKQETLVRLDCRGELRPGLATQWASDSTGKVWTFLLRHRDPRDSTITATAVVSVWDTSAVLGGMGIESAMAMDAHTLRVILRAPSDSAPRLFADPALALNPDSGAAVNPRDALDRGADLVVSSDPSVSEYVSRRPDFMTFALPWSRTYVLVQPAGVAPIIRGLGSDSVVRSLASDVVPAEARPAQSPFWWEGQESCRSEASSSAGTRLPRIIYRRADPVAAALAERIVALAENPALRAAGVSDSEFVAGYESQAYLGYLMGLPRQAAAPCYRSRQLRQGNSIQPLIDTRARAIVRRGSGPWTVDWDGSVRAVRDSASAAP